MHADLIYEALHFLERKDLETCQLSAKFLNTFIASSTRLPLRCIDFASIDGRSVKLRTKKNETSDADDDEDEEAFRRRIVHDYEKDLTVEDFDEFVRHLRNVCIEMLAIGFTQEDGPVVRYWLASHSSDNFCLMEIYQETRGTSMVYELFDDTLRILKPQQYSSEVGGAFNPQQRIRQRDILTRVLQRESLQTAALCLKVDVFDADIPAALVTAWASSSWYACDIWCQNASASSWVDDLIVGFLNGTLVNLPEASLSILWDKPNHGTKPRLLHHPAQTDVPKPRTDFIDRHYSNRNELRCDLHTFDNKNSRQSLRVYIWGIVDLEHQDDGNDDVHACAFVFNFGPL